jgi:hypothetical protein
MSLPLTVGSASAACPREEGERISLEEFARTVAYMGRAAGGNWKDPDTAMLDRIRKEENERIEELKARN